MRITSEEVARLANVSRSTVSRVVNGYTNVPEETRRKVMEVIEASGYVPNSYARVLAGKSSMEIALVISNYNIGEERWKGMESAYFMQLIAELVSVGKKYGGVISVLVISNEADWTRLENMFLNRQICGGIFVGFEFQMEWINEMIAKGFEMVVIDPTEEMLQKDNVRGIYTENEKAAHLITKYLLKKGYRHVVHISGDKRLSSVERLKGYQQAMKDAGLEEEMAVEVGLYDGDLAYKLTKKLLSERVVDAIFAANDRMAIMAIRAVNDSGLKVPEDIAVVGCDYDAFYEDIGFHLTTVEMSVQEVARDAIKFLLGYDKKRRSVCRAKLRKGFTA